MLARPLRVTSPADHRRIGRNGKRAGAGTLVVHLELPTVRQPDGGQRTPPSRAGIVVGRSVGNSVVRHRVSRRLRHLLASRLSPLPAGTAVVVRAAPPAARATSAALGADLDRALARALRPGPSRSGGARPVANR